MARPNRALDGGRFDFDDGGCYVGEWQDGRAHGVGIATGPENQGEYSGEWCLGFESRGVYIWPSGNIYAGTWLKGKRHGEGVQIKGEWIYKGAFTTGFCGRYGVKEAINSPARYEGSWHLNLFDGFGIETNSDGSVYAGAWSKGVRQGLGVRRSVPYGLAADQNDKSLRPSQSQTSMGSDSDKQIGYKPGERRLDEIRSGFVLRDRPDTCDHGLKKGLFQKKAGLKSAFMRKLRKQKSTGDLTNTNMKFARQMQGGSMRSNDSGQSQMTSHSLATGWGANSLMAPVGGATAEDVAATLPSSPSPEIIIDPNVTESYSGQWNEDKRSGHGVAERSDGLKYEGEWFGNKKDGYGRTTFPNGSQEEGRYKSNMLVTAVNKRNVILMLRHSRLKEYVEEAVRKAQEAAREAIEKGIETAQQRAQSARVSAQNAEKKAVESRKFSQQARLVAQEVAPDFEQPGVEWEKNRGKPRSHHKRGEHTHQDGCNEFNPNQPNEVLEVSGSRRGSFRSSFRRQKNNSGGEESMFRANNATSNFGEPPSRHGSGKGKQDCFTDTLLSNQKNRNRQNNLQPGQIGQHGKDEKHEKPRVPEITPLTQMADHFDYYQSGNPQSLLSRAKRDSGLGRDSSLEDSVTGGLPNNGGGQPAIGFHRWDSGTPDSGMSELSQTSKGSRSRRRTLPSIMTAAPITPKMTAASPPEPSKEHEEDTFIIENCIRKRVHDESTRSKPTLQRSIALDGSGTPPINPHSAMLYHRPEQEDLAPLPRNYRIESQLALGKDLGEGSLPDVSVCKSLQRQTLMTREEVTRLSQARRQELLQEAERRRRGEVIIRLADIKDWVKNHILLVTVFTINLGLAFLFFYLMAPSNIQKTNGKKTR